MPPMFVSKAGKPELGVWVIPDIGGGGIMFMFGVPIMDMFIGVMGETELTDAGFIVLFIDAPPGFICAIIIIICCCCIMNWTCSGVMLPCIEFIIFIYICCIWAIIAIYGLSAGIDTGVTALWLRLPVA